MDILVHFFRVHILASSLGLKLVPWAMTYIYFNPGAEIILSHVWNQRVQRPRQGRLDNHSEVTLFQGYCDFTVD